MKIKDMPMTTAGATYNYDAVKTAVNPAFPAKPMPMTHPPCHSFPTTTTHAAFSVCVWLSKDPIGEHGGLSLYVFGINSIPNNYDLLGRLSVKSLRDPKPNKCGEYIWEVQFELDQNEKGKSGWIVQKVVINKYVILNGKEQHATTDTFWEGWKVTSEGVYGRVEIAIPRPGVGYDYFAKWSLKGEGEKHDTYQREKSQCKTGKEEVIGKVIFREQSPVDNLPPGDFTFPRHDETRRSGSLPSTKVQPYLVDAGTRNQGRDAFSNG